MNQEKKTFKIISIEDCQIQKKETKKPGTKKIRLLQDDEEELNIDKETNLLKENLQLYRNKLHQTEMEIISLKSIHAEMVEAKAKIEEYILKVEEWKKNYLHEIDTLNAHKVTNNTLQDNLKIVKEEV